MFSFPFLCFATFVFLTTYWLVLSLCKKTIHVIKKRSTFTSSVNTLINKEKANNINTSIQKIHINNSPQTTYYNNNLQQNAKQFQSKVTNVSQNLQNLNSHLSQAYSLKIPERVFSDDPSVASSSNILNMGMVQYQEHQQKKAEDQVQDQIENQEPILIQINLAESEKSQDEDSNQQNRNTLQIEQKLNQQKHKNHEKMKKQQKSELQIIQALQIGKFFQKSDHVENQIPIVERKQSQVDSVLVKLIQQIDELFLNDQQMFMQIMNKYRIQEARFSHPVYDEQNYKNKIQKLQEDIKIKNQQMDRMEIQISQYKSQNQSKENKMNQILQQITSLIQIIGQQEKNISKQLKNQLNKEKLQQTNFKYKQIKLLVNQINSLKSRYQKLVQNGLNNKNQNKKQNLQKQKQKQLEYEKEIKKLKKQIQQSKHKIEKQLQNGEALDAKVSNLQDQLASKNKFIQSLKQQIILINKKSTQHINLCLVQKQQEYRRNQQTYKQKIDSLQRQLSKAKQQVDHKKKQYQNQIQQKQSKQLYNNKQTANDVKQKLYNINQQFQQNVDKNQQSSIVELKRINENLKNQIQFAQTQIRMLQQSQNQYLKQISTLQKQLQTSKHANPEIYDLRSKVLYLDTQIARMQPIVNEYQIMQRRYFQLKSKLQKITNQKQKSRLVNSRTMQNNVSSFITISSPKVVRKSHDENSSNIETPSSDKKSTPTGHYRFLFDCSFINLPQRQFVYQTINNLLKGVLKTEKLYNSKTNKSKNPHELIDNIRGILVLIELQNGKIVGAYTHQAFSSLSPHSTNDNIGFILDISNRKSFVNQSGLNSISYNANSLIWGFSQILLKFQQPEVLYTNFCRNHNIYWDGKHKIEDFIGCQKQWARINQYQLFRLSKI